MPRTIALGLLVAATALSGCATKEYVHEYVGSQLKPVNARIDANEAADQQLARGTESRLSQHENRLNGHEERIGRAESAIESLRANVREALDRATAAGKLAEGKLCMRWCLPMTSSVSVPAVRP